MYYCRTHFSLSQTDLFLPSWSRARDIDSPCASSIAKTSMLRRICRVPAARMQSTAAARPVVPLRPLHIERELPDPFADKKKNRWYFGVYAVGVVASCAVIFNYEKTRSPIINSVMYCLRRSEAAKQSLGPNIGFESSWPWIWGPLNAVSGHVDIEYRVKGDLALAVLRMKADRESRQLPFDMQQLRLEFDDGRVVDLKQDPSIDFEF